MIEKEIGKKLVFEGRVFRIWEVEAELDGVGRVQREIMERKLGVVVCVFLDELGQDANIFLVREYHPAVEEIRLSLPGGRFDPKEEIPSDACVRELREEVGLRPKNIEQLFEFHGGKTWVWHQYFFFAYGAINDPLELDSDEKLEVVKMPFKKFLNLVINNEPGIEISDYKAVVMVAMRLGLINIKQ